MTTAAPLLKLQGIRFGYGTAPPFLGPISMAVERGQCWGIVGPNGAGKSTLIRLMAGLLSPREGVIQWESQPLDRLPLRERARRIGFLPQQPPEAGDFTVRDVVLMGRFPHRSFGLFETAQDHQIADEAMRRTDVDTFADRTVASLSGGEAQRVHLASVLAQQADLIVLDEPTSSLDIRHQLAVFDIVRGVLRQREAAAVVVLHDINLAAFFCTHVALLHDGRLVAAGDPSQVLSEQQVEEVYGVTMSAVHTVNQRRWLIPHVDPERNLIRGIP